jgi:hypothetical protein
MMILLTVLAVYQFDLSMVNLEMLRGTFNLVSFPTFATEEVFFSLHLILLFYMQSVIQSSESYECRAH